MLFLQQYFKLYFYFMHITAATNFIKTTAQALGFSHVGIAKAAALPNDARRLEQWLNKNMHGTMHYMANHFDLRVDPTKLVPGAKSVITLLLNYYPAKKQNSATNKIAKYAYGQDYHHVIKAKLKNLLAQIRGTIGAVDGRGFVDSAPVLERTWAQKSGLGFVGKNGNLINKKAGSFFFIATLIVDIDLEYDTPYLKDFCGTCTKCIDSCPTEAILPNKVVNGSKCIAYFTIELKDALIDDNYKTKFDNWMFGCDTCQDVCPWNSFSQPHSHPELQPIHEVLNYTEADWEELTEEKFKIIFSQSAIKRSKFSGIKRNINFIKL
jgi:epoxyqueuosine reductase